MSKVFKLVGLLTIVGGVLLGLAMLSGGFAAIVAILGSIISGCLFISVGDLLERVNYLEEALGQSRSGANASQSDLPQKKCAKCGKKYDFDYPKCPHCGNADPNVGG